MIFAPLTIPSMPIRFSPTEFQNKEVKVSCKNTFLHFAELNRDEQPSPAPQSHFSIIRRRHSDVTDSQAMLFTSPKQVPQIPAVQSSPALSDMMKGSPKLLPVDEVHYPLSELSLPPVECEFDMLEDGGVLSFCQNVMGTQMAHAVFGTEEENETDYEDPVYTQRPSKQPHSNEKIDDYTSQDRFPKGCTTVMLRNIPNKYTRQMLIHVLNKNFIGKYDFMYLPIDFKNKCNVGYGFVNFRAPETCRAFIRHFHGVDVRKSLPGFNSKKVCEVTPARVQGLNDNVRRLQNSPIMNQLKEHPDWLPVLFDTQGNCEPFPCPEEPMKPRVNIADAGIKSRREKERRWEGRPNVRGA